MQNITVEQIKAEAAMLGFHNRPMDELVKMVKSSIHDQFQKNETKLKTKKAYFSKKIEALESKNKSVKNRVGETIVEPGSILMALSGLLFCSLLFYGGYIDSLVAGLLCLGLGIGGAVIVHIKQVDSDYWKPVLFTSLACLTVLMQSFIYYDNGYAFFKAFLFAVPFGIMCYFLNENLFNSIFSFISQSSALWHRIHQKINRFRRFYNHKLLINTEKRMESSHQKKELMIQKSTSYINSHYNNGVLAANLDKKNLSVNHFQLNGKGNSYAN